MTEMPPVRRPPARPTATSFPLPRVAPRKGPLVLQAIREPFEPAIADAERVQGVDCRQHIVRIVAGLAVTALHIDELFFERERARILRVSAIDEIANGG